MDKVDKKEEQWIITILGKQFTVKATSKYRARRTAAETYNKDMGTKHPPAFLMNASQIRTTCDRRIKYDYLTLLSPSNKEVSMGDSK